MTDNPGNVYEALPRSSASSADDVVGQLGRTTPSVSTLVDIYDGEAVDPAYQAKSHAISCAIQQIGMGRYQVRSLYRVGDPRVRSAERDWIPSAVVAVCCGWLRVV